MNVQLPLAASLQRTAAVNDKIDAILKETPGVKYYTGVAGFSLLSFAFTTYNSFYFVTLEDWDERDKHGLTADVIMRDLNRRLAGLPDAQAFAFSPPVIPGIGTSGGVTFMLEDRAGKDPAFLAENTAKFLAAARQRPEFALLFTTLLPERAPALRRRRPGQGAQAGHQPRVGLPDAAGVHGQRLRELLQRVRPGLAGVRPGRGGLPDAGPIPSRSSMCATRSNQPVPLSSLVTMKPVSGPEFTVRFNEYRAAQINGILAPGVSSRQGMQALEEVFAQTMPREMGFDYSGMSFQEQVAAQGVPPAAVFGFSLLVVFLLLAALYESWTLPFGVLLGTPIAVLGAVAALWLAAFRAGRVLADRPDHGDRPRGQERDPDRGVREGRARARRVPGRRRARGRPRPPAADPHDGLRLHPRRGSARGVDRRRRQLATHPRHDRDRRHARRHRHRDLHHPGHVLREPSGSAGSRRARGGAAGARAGADLRRGRTASRPRAGCAREVPGGRVRGRRRGVARRLRDRPRLQASARDRGPDVPRPVGGGGGVARGPAVVGGVRGPRPEGPHPGSARQQLRREDRRRPHTGSARPGRGGALAVLPADRLQLRRRPQSQPRGRVRDPFRA